MTGQQLIERWIGFVRRYVVMSDAQALVVALWAVHTWVYENFAATPYLEIAAKTKRSGKTTLLELLKMLCRGAEQYATVRILTVLRMAEHAEGRFVALFDEAEQFSGATLGDTRQALAVGYRQGAYHAVTSGKDVSRFRAYFPKAFALIGNVHAVLRDRCIELVLERAKPERMLSEWRGEAMAEAQECISELIAWSRQHAGKRIPIVAADWLSTRERELWTPIWSIASWLGLHADTLEVLKAASVDMGLLKTLEPMRWHSDQAETDEEDREMAVRVLQDIRSVVKAGETFIPSGVLVDRLRAIATAPWRGWRGVGLNEQTLSTLLDRFAITSSNGRIGKRADNKVVKGYKVRDIEAVKL